jgi:hypothetical protein
MNMASLRSGPGLKTPYLSLREQDHRGAWPADVFYGELDGEWTDYTVCIPMWNIHPMAMGYTIGFCTKLTQNTFREYTADYGNRYVHAALMGDPTLRMHVIKPVTNVVIEAGENSVNLNWAESPDEILGYYIYRSGDSFSNFTRISELVTSTSYTDHAPLTGNNVYMVRALKLERSCSGTYYNLSQGIIDSVFFPMTNASKESIPLIKVYPNPILSDQFVVEMESTQEERIRIGVINPMGSVVYDNNVETKTGSNCFSVCVPGRRTGIYMIILRGDSFFRVSRIVKN